MGFRQECLVSKIDSEFMAVYQLNYGFTSDGQAKPTIPDAPTPEAPKPTPETKQKQTKKAEWFQVEKNKNAKVYVSGLPESITEEKFINLNGVPKGDALCSYVMVESVDLSIQILDDSLYEDGKIQNTSGKSHVKIRNSCEKFGRVKRLEVYDQHVDGIGMISFNDPIEADLAIQMLNGRLFNGRKQMMNNKKRYEAWKKFLDDGDEEEEEDKDNHPESLPKKKTKNKQSGYCLLEMLRNYFGDINLLPCNLSPASFDGMDGAGNIIFSSNRLSSNPHYVKLNILYSAKKSVESNSLVYANYAQEKDFAYLRSIGVGISDKILIAHDPPAYTNDHRVEMSSKFGSGLLIDDYGRGDPLTPGWSSLDGSVKLKLLNLYSLPHIPVHYINSEIARNIMSKLGGRDTPKDWIELERVKLQVHSINEIRSIKNIVGMIKGSVEPDRYIIFGSNRAASNDSPNESLSGISAIVKLARSFSETMKRYNWRPRRSILFVSWGAKEFGLLGSTEWIEENLPLLKNRLVAYINLDECYSGSLMSIKASPGMSKILLKSSKKLKDPFDSTKVTTIPKLKDLNVRQNQGNTVTNFMELDKTEDDGFFEDYDDEDDLLKSAQRPLSLLGSEGDYYPFFLFVKYSFSGYTVYILIKKLEITILIQILKKSPSSNDLKNLQLCIRYASDVMRNFADSVILPFEPNDYSLILMEGINYIKSNLTYSRLFSSKDISLKYLEQSISEFTTVSANWTNYVASLAPEQNPMMARMINDQIVQLPRLFSLHDDHRNITTNILFGPDIDPSISVPFPRLRLLIRKLFIYSEENIGEANTETNPRIDEHIFNLKKHITELFIAIKNGIKQLKPF
ncbi:FOLH1 [Lepeophtheirus salmonis]|uniref:FOLH1 n=1 Tax=Lepeophtheirus salmonis TaxID=72036 RepID=A0A7R8H0K0_LEPSM|nr:FOLH1 [Lepeophtheirus salmonis]CAF2791348.1 FOLH1 [Lepeophtheirus salmonis]